MRQEGLAGPGLGLPGNHAARSCHRRRGEPIGQRGRSERRPRAGGNHQGRRQDDGHQCSPIRHRRVDRERRRLARQPVQSGGRPSAQRDDRNPLQLHHGQRRRTGLGGWPGQGRACRSAARVRGQPHGRAAVSTPLAVRETVSGGHGRRLHRRCGTRGRSRRRGQAGRVFRKLEAIPRTVVQPDLQPGTSARLPGAVRSEPPGLSVRARR